MSDTKHETSTIDRIKRDFGMDVVPFLNECKANDMALEDIAIMVDCSVSNLRRILRSVRFTFFIRDAEPKLRDCSIFQNKKMNAENCLSRKWVA
jgi:hypothetical protein